MRMLIHQGANDTDIRRVAERGGMITMRNDAQRWIDAGVTSQEEALRVTRMSAARFHGMQHPRFCNRAGRTAAPKTGALTMRGECTCDAQHRVHESRLT
jgi:hypothetical protein